jgi:hypothetical protein
LEISTGNKNSEFNFKDLTKLDIFLNNHTVVDMYLYSDTLNTKKDYIAFMGLAKDNEHKEVMFSIYGYILSYGVIR